MKVHRTMMAAFALVCCSTAHAGLKHRYSFDGNADDSVGGANGTVVDAGAPTAVYAAGRLDVSTNTGQGSDSGIDNDAYVNFPNDLVSDAAADGVAGGLTVEIWAQSTSNANWRALFSAGTSNDGEGRSSGGQNADYIQLIPQHGGGGPRPSSIRATTHAAGNGTEGFADHTAALSTSAIQHLVAVFDQSGGLPGTVSLYVDGALTESKAIATGLNIAAMNDNNVWLGRSQWPDQVFIGVYDELRIYDHALDAARVATNFQLGPGTVPEPASVALAGLAVTALAASRRRAKR